MMKLLIIQFLILIVGISAILGFVLSEQQSTSYIVTDLDLTTHEPYAYESTYAQDMGLEEWFGVRTFEIIPDALGHSVINGTEINHKHGEDAIVHFPSTSDAEESQFFIILIGSIVIIMVITVTLVYGKDIFCTIKLKIIGIVAVVAIAYFIISMYTLCTINPFQWGNPHLC